MIAPASVVAALEAAGFTHLVWIPDSHLGTWDAALAGSKLAPIRVFLRIATTAVVALGPLAATLLAAAYSHAKRR